MGRTPSAFALSQDRIDGGRNQKTIPETGSEKISQKY